MKSARRNVGVGCVLMAALAVTGCNQDRMQLEAQQARIAQLEQEKNDLQNQLAAALRDARAARDRAAELQRLLDAAGRAAPTETASGWMEKDGVAWTNIAEDILFDSGKADLKSSGRSKLQEIVRQIGERYPTRDILVIGHTDTDPILKTKGIWKDNLHLSQWRGRVVALELMAMGIDAKRMIAAGQGEYNPIAPNDNKANKQKNRRVQIVAVNPPSIQPGDSSGMVPVGGGVTIE